MVVLVLVVLDAGCWVLEVVVSCKLESEGDIGSYIAKGLT
jgi:hypothetical protein